LEELSECVMLKCIEYVSKSFIGDMDIETRRVCVRVIIDYY